MNPRSARRANRPVGCSPFWRRNNAHSTGVSVSETKAEATTATATVTANSRNSRPMIPPMKNSGMNTAMSEKVMETMVKPICPAPFSAAAIGSIPSSM